MFLPTTRAEIKKLSWDRLDVIIVTGDTYIDSPYIGAAVIGKVLQAAGYKVGIIAQPNTEGEKDGRAFSILGSHCRFGRFNGG